MNAPDRPVRLTRPADALRPRFAALIAEEEAIIAEIQAGISRLHDLGETVANMDAAFLRSLAGAVTSSPDPDHRRAAEVASEVLAIERRHHELTAQQSRWRAKAVALIEASFESREPLERFQRGLPSSWPNPRIEELEQDLRQFEHEHNKLSALHDQLDLYESVASRPSGSASRPRTADSKPWPAVIREAFLKQVGTSVAIAVLALLLLVFGAILPALGLDVTDLVDALRGVLG